MYSDEPPMCCDDNEDKNAKEIFVRGLVGELIRCTAYEDGSITYHHGGMGGDVSYNQYGEEC
jgi:hypothetical protein